MSDRWLAGVTGRPMPVWDPEVQECLQVEGEFLLVDLLEGFAQNRLVEEKLELHRPQERELRQKMGRSRAIRRQVAMNHREIWERHHPTL